MSLPAPSPSLEPGPERPIHEEANQDLADAADRAADMCDLATDNAARILANGEARVVELLATARTQAAAITQAATADTEQARAAASREAVQLVTNAQRRADNLTSAASIEADRLLADVHARVEQVRLAAEQDAVKVLADAGTKRTELLVEAEHAGAAARSRATTESAKVLERARTEADGMRDSADTHSTQVRAAAEKAAADIRQDADRALAEASTCADKLLAGAEKDAARLLEHARAEGDRILAEATQRTVKRARRREIRADSRAARRKARQDARPVGGVPPLSGQEMAGAVAIVLAAATVSTLGLLSSYTALEDAARGWGWSWPWLLPVGIDVAIPAFTGANLILIRMGMELRWIRWVPRALTGATVYLNWQASDDLAGRLGHAALTLLWVVFSEIAAHVYATRIGAVTGKKRMETVRRSRWLLAPIPTARLRRRMILWEITSYEEALKRLQEQTWLRARLKEKYGRRWRSKAPLEQRMALKLGTEPASLADTLTPENAHTIERVADTKCAHPEPSTLIAGNACGEHERQALPPNAHGGERTSESSSAHGAQGTRSRSATDALTERRHERIRLLYTELGRRPQWKDIRKALTEAALSDKPVSRPTAQRLRTQVERKQRASPHEREPEWVSEG
ncbi:DUF2637 domain-containing protein [Streptomyces sp. NPDC057445]|uniref:DUF2637 domain-containing protein n=1 Tax=Streptomyces sp. NPDC057445 TaxID=3346136 RepID=UPI003691B071